MSFASKVGSLVFSVDPIAHASKPDGFFTFSGVVVAATDACKSAVGRGVTVTSCFTGVTGMVVFGGVNKFSEFAGGTGFVNGFGVSGAAGAAGLPYPNNLATLSAFELNFGGDCSSFESGEGFKSYNFLTPSAFGLDFLGSVIFDVGGVLLAVDSTTGRLFSTVELLPVRLESFTGSSLVFTTKEVKYAPQVAIVDLDSS